MSEVKTSRTLLVDEVLRGKPCYEYSSKLNERFNVEIEVTVELALQQADDWDWYWAASRLLTERGYDAFFADVPKFEDDQYQSLAPLRELAREARVRAVAEYDRVMSVEMEKSGVWYSTAAYMAAVDTYDEINLPYEAALRAAREATQSRVNKVAAKTFAELYISEDGTTDPTGNDKRMAKTTATTRTR